MLDMRKDTGIPKDSQTIQSVSDFMLNFVEENKSRLEVKKQAQMMSDGLIHVLKKLHGALKEHFFSLICLINHI